METSFAPAEFAVADHFLVIDRGINVNHQNLFVIRRSDMSIPANGFFDLNTGNGGMGSRHEVKISGANYVITPVATAPVSSLRDFDLGELESFVFTERFGVGIVDMRDCRTKNGFKQVFYDLSGSIIIHCKSGLFQVENNSSIREKIFAHNC